MKYLVTGHNGFIGSNLLTKLSDDVVKLERDFLDDEDWKYKLNP